MATNVSQIQILNTPVKMYLDTDTILEVPYLDTRYPITRDRPNRK